MLIPGLISLVAVDVCCSGGENTNDDDDSEENSFKDNSDKNDRIIVEQ